MGKKHMVSKNPHARKRPKFSFRKLPPGAKSPTLVVADYIFGDEHGESPVSWLMRKLDHYKNDSSFTSDVSSEQVEGDETPTLRLRTDFSDLTEVDHACKKNLFQEHSGDACNEVVPLVDGKLSVNHVLISA